MIKLKHNFIYLAVLLLSVGLYKSQLSQAENFVYSKTYLEPVITSNSVAKGLETVTYYDGLGRPKQILNVKASPSGNDIVSPIIYDEFGRQTKDYLPMPQSDSSNGAIYQQNQQSEPPVSNPIYPILYPSETIFYSKKVLENSPLDRVQQQVQVGNAWNSKPIVFGYETNTAIEVKKFTTTTSWSNNASNSTLTQSGNYGSAQLYKNIVSDEDENTTVEFKNGKGQILLIRKNDGTNDSDTYYVYNEYNQLAFIIQPEAAVKATLSATDLDEFCFQYRYDGQHRLVEKKVPGKGWEYMVYDNQDRLVMTQESNLGANKQWLFTKYDMLGRVAYMGLYTSTNNYDSAGRDYEQGQVNAKGSNNVERTTDGFAQPGLLVYYDNDVNKNYPNTFNKILSVNYYDSYPLGTVFPVNNKIQDINIITQIPNSHGISTKSLSVASFVNNVETTGWTKNYTWYDEKARPVGTYSYNHLGGYTKTEKVLDFAGVIQRSYTYHKRKTADAEVIVKEDFEYDHQNRLEEHYHEVLGKSPVTVLAENIYNEIGQLSRKKVGKTDKDFLQEIDYSYNIRGWMTGINSGDIPVDAPYTLNNGKLFGYRIKYTDPVNASLADAKYNGNISEIDWIDRDSSLKRYGYQYDRMNRLLKGNYQDPEEVLPETHINDEALTYDLNGNIKTLVRNAKHGKYYTPVVIDKLEYNYTGNRLTSIIDNSSNINGYEGGGQPISYDTNGSGNMTRMPDKKIDAIAYNFLNLPTQINQKTNTFKYYYRADGVKLKKQFTLVNSSGTNIINTEYLDGFQYSTPYTLPLAKALKEQDEMTISASTAGEEEAFTRDTERNIVVVDPGTPQDEPMILSFFPTSEGYYDYEKFRYIYQYKDHLGNIRVSYTKNNSKGDLTITDRNDYYPFGMNFLKPVGKVSIYDPIANPYNYKYQGQELQETGFYSFKWRNYMPDVGRFTTIDPLAEKYNTWSPYSFAGNRVSVFRELEGLEPFDEPFDPAEEEMRETGESPLIRQARFNPYNPNTYRSSETSRAPLINPESIEESYTDIEEVVVTGAKATQGFFERAIDWIGEQFTGDSNTPQVRQNAQKGANFEQVVKQDLKTGGETNIQEQVTIKPNQPGAKNVKIDMTSNKNGVINLTEAKSSTTAPLTKNQTAGFPIIQNSGGTVVGKGKPGIPGGTVIPPTTVNVVRPKENKTN